MKIILILILVGILSACASTPSIQVPKEVKVEVRIPCTIDEPTAPTLRYSPPYADIFEATQDLLGDRIIMLAYENELLINFRGCKR